MDSFTSKKAVEKKLSFAELCYNKQNFGPKFITVSTEDK